jgi:hypothetical protein
MSAAAPAAVRWHGATGEHRIALALKRPDLHDSRPIVAELSCDPHQSSAGLVASDHFHTGAIPYQTLDESGTRALRDWLGGVR